MKSFLEFVTLKALFADTRYDNYSIQIIIGKR